MESEVAGDRESLLARQSTNLPVPPSVQTDYDLYQQGKITDEEFQKRYERTMQSTGLPVPRFLQKDFSLYKQGKITDEQFQKRYERKMAQRAKKEPKTEGYSPKQRVQLKAQQRANARDLRAGKRPRYPEAMYGRLAGAEKDQPPTIRSRAELAALPRGTEFIGPDGKRRRKV
jgi:hypothetical protein